MNKRIAESAPITFCPETGRWSHWIQGKPGSLRWIEEFHKNGTLKASKKGSTKQHIVFVGGPWNGTTFRRTPKSEKGGKGGLKFSGRHDASGRPLPEKDWTWPDVWFAKEFDGHYEYRKEHDDFYWRNP